MERPTGSWAVTRDCLDSPSLVTAHDMGQISYSYPLSCPQRRQTERSTTQLTSSGHKPPISDHSANLENSRLCRCSIIGDHSAIFQLFLILHTGHSGCLYTEQTLVVSTQSKVWLPPTHGKLWLPPTHGKLWLPPTHSKLWLPSTHGKLWLPPTHSKLWLPPTHGKLCLPHPSSSITIPTCLTPPVPGPAPWRERVLDQSQIPQISCCWRKTEIGGTNTTQNNHRTGTVTLYYRTGTVTLYYRTGTVTLYYRTGTVTLYL